MLVILGDTLRVSVGDLFLAAMGPGLMLGGLYVAYLILVAIFRPDMMPPLPREARQPWLPTLLRLIKDLLAPLGLIFIVLGSIIAGIATPTESAALGALGAFLLAVFSGGLNRRQFADVIHSTTKTSAMIIFVMIGATVFSSIFRRLGGDTMIADALTLGSASPYWSLALIMLLIFLLGMFLDWVEITLIVLPIVAPVIVSLDFGLPSDQVLIWFAILFAVNLQTSFLTPPFGYALFYIRGIAPPEIGIKDVYRGIMPFVFIQITALLLTILFPEIALWLPETLFG